jgi:hypothetical protein
MGYSEVNVSRVGLSLMLLSLARLTSGVSSSVEYPATGTHSLVSSKLGLD